MLFISHGERYGGGGQDPLQTALWDLAAPIPEDADGEALEAHRMALNDSAQRLATMRRLSKAHQREVDRAIGGTPAAGVPSRIGAVRQREAAIASMLGADRPTYAMPQENIRATQAATPELEHLEGDERRCMMERVQQLLDAAATQQVAGRRVVEPVLQDENQPPHREDGATSWTPTGGARGR